MWKGYIRKEDYQKAFGQGKRQCQLILSLCKSKVRHQGMSNPKFRPLLCPPPPQELSTHVF